MANVLVQESSLRAIADAIRQKNGSQDTYTPAQMGPAILDISGGSAPVLISKGLKQNGVYYAADDSADGYYEIITNIQPGRESTVFYDLDTGYVMGGNWRIGGDSVSYSDVYAVSGGVTYLIALGETVGTRFRAMFSTRSTVDAVSDLSGTAVVNVSNPNPYAAVIYTPLSDGYVTITKDNAGRDHLNTYVFNLPDLTGVINYHISS